MTIKKIMNLKSKTKYISQKKFVQQQKLPIIKLKKIKSNQPILSGSQKKKPILSKTNNLVI